VEQFLPVILYALLGFMIIGSLIAVQTADLLSAVISVGAVGFGLALVDLFLGAPDLALTQVVVEILVLVMLIRLVIQRKDPTEQQPPGTLLVSLVMMILGVTIFPIIIALNDMIPFGEPLFTRGGELPSLAVDYMKNAISQTGATNIVTAILLDLRAYDTLGEATVVFASIIGAYAVLRKVGRIQREKDTK
jgi:multisubunit Na+/H+ antiporter MnhB subunit